MEKPVRGWTLAELAGLLSGEPDGPATLRIVGPAPAGSGGADTLTFAGDEKHLALAEGSEVGAVLVPKGFTSTKPVIRVESPKAAFGKFLALVARPLPIEVGVHPTAVVHPSASISPTASVGAYAVIECHAVIGDRCRVYPFCFVGESCVLAEDSVLFPHAVLYQDVSIGVRSIVHAGAVLGADGFGFVWDGERHQKVPQVGAVVIGPDSEIGAASTIDRATIGATEVGADVKIDNLVQVGHNTRVGNHTVVASGSGISGSCEIGERVTLAGMVGIGDHVRIADGVIIGARSATTIDVPDPGIYVGFPLRPLAHDRRLMVHYGRLPDMAKKLKDLEQRLAELESKSE